MKAFGRKKFQIPNSNSGGVVPGGAMAHPDFGRSVNPISTRGDRLCPPNYYGTPGFSDLPMALTNCSEGPHARKWEDRI